MGHPAINNKTPFALETLFLADEDGQPLLVPVIKATYQIRADGQLSIAEKQAPVNPSGEHWGGPATASYKYEPEIAFIKPATDIVLIGHAYAPRPGATQVDVGLRVGRMKKVVRVFGDRWWMKSLNTILMTKPLSFDRIALIYERAFGGWDRSDIDPDKHTFDPRNPVGTGFIKNHEQFKEQRRLPNLEDPRRLIQDISDKPDPIGFGFISPHWQPRAALAGTYDKTWTEQRMPLLPKDFDRRYFNGAPGDQVFPGYLTGNEPVEITNASPGGRISFNLPNIQPPQCRVIIRNRDEQNLQSRLDTVIINTDENLLFLIWRTNLPLQNGPHDVVSVEISADENG
jgi:hypothetical protein